MRPLPLTLLFALAPGLAGCVLPPAVSIASFVADGASLVGTGKTTTDHAISLLAGEDCRLWRALKGKPICQSDTTVVALAKLPPPLPLHAASPALHPPEQNAAIAGFVVDEPNAHIAIPFPTPAATAPVRAALPVLRPTASSPAVVAGFVLDEPDAAIPIRIPAASVARKTVAALTAPGGDATKPAQAKATAPQAATPTRPEPVAMATPARGGAVRGEMVIRSGTAEVEARALAQSLSAVGASVRPVRHGDITIYEVVMGLSG